MTLSAVGGRGYQFGGVSVGKAASGDMPPGFGDLLGSAGWSEGETAVDSPARHGDEVEPK